MCVVESLRNVFVSSDNPFGFKRGLSSSHAIYTVKHWRRQLWGSGARAPSTSSCLIFLVTSEPHRL